MFLNSLNKFLWSISVEKNTEALEQINLIQQVIQGNNRLLFNGRKLMVIGVILGLIPIFEMGLERVIPETMASYWQVLIRVIFYYLISFAGIRLFALSNSKPKTALPSVLSNAFELHGVILKVLVLLDIILGFSGYADLILPLNFILLGLLFNLFARFTVKTLAVVSWSYILLGLLGVAFHNYLSENAWQIELYYLGATYILMGILLERRNHG